MKIKEIAFVCYAVSDIPKARNFYERILGLKATNEWIGKDMGFIEYSFGPKESYTFAIGQGAPQFKPGRNGGTVALEVKNFNDTIKSLKKSRVKFIMKPHENKSCFMALVLDPSGNQIMIHKRKVGTKK